MTDRISIPALRERAELAEVVYIPTVPATLLALVEAVEAAQRFAADPGADSGELDAALARFDFGEEA